jgi:hypothetical protein
MKRLFVTTFTNDHTLLDAVRTVRDRGWRIVDAYAPCPVHGLEDALGLRPSRLPAACFLLGVLGAAFMMWLQHWTSAVDWRLNVGGRPWNSSLSFACVAFEVMVLTAGIGTVILFLVVARLRPGAEPQLAIAGVTDDRFALVIEETTEPLDGERLRAALAGSPPETVEERIVEGQA